MCPSLDFVPPPFPSSPKSYLSFSLYGTVYVRSEGEPTDVHLVAGTDVHDAGLLSFLCINVHVCGVEALQEAMKHQSPVHVERLISIYQQL